MGKRVRRGILGRLPDPGLVRTRPEMIAAVVGLLYVAGGLLVTLSMLLPHPEQADMEAILAVALLALALGPALLLWRARVGVAGLHAAIALGSGLICLVIYLSGVAAGVYSAMFVWIVLLTAYFFPGRAAVLHLGWLVGAYGASLLMLGQSAGFSPGSRWLLTSLALLVASLIVSWLVAGRERSERVLMREVAARRRLEAELRHLADHDSLTGLPNRRFFEQEAAAVLAQAARDGAPVCVALLDLDRFKELNDTRGHAAGDELLRRAAVAWRDVLRSGDVIARYGGDEFAVALLDSDLAQAREVADRLRAATPDGQSCSVGLAEWDSGESLERAIARADEALYADKERGARAGGRGALIDSG